MGKKILLNTRMLTTPELAAADSSQNKLNTGCRSLQSSPSTVCLPFQTHLRHWWEFLFPSSPSRQGLRARKWQGCSRPKRLQKSSCWVRQDTPEGSGCRPACRTCQCTYPQKWCFRKECAAHKEEISISLIAFWYFNFDLQQKKRHLECCKIWKHLEHQLPTLRPGLCGMPLYLLPSPWQWALAKVG